MGFLLRAIAYCLLVVVLLAVLLHIPSFKELVGMAAMVVWTCVAVALSAVMWVAMVAMSFVISLVQV